MSNAQRAGKRRLLKEWILIRRSKSAVPPQLTTPPEAVPPQLQQSSLRQPHQDLWNNALSHLTVEEKAIVLEHSPPGSASLDEMLNDILNAAQEKRRICEAKHWEVEFRGHRVILRKVADAVCDSLDKFKQIGDVVVNVDPLHAGLPWAGIRLLIQVCAHRLIVGSSRFLIFGLQGCHIR
jgi:hypothetical protein